MGRIIIAVPNSPAGEIALNHIQQQPTFFDVTTQTSLTSLLEDSAITTILKPGQAIRAASLRLVILIAR